MILAKRRHDDFDIALALFFALVVLFSATPVAIAAPSIALSATTGAPGTPVTATIANGPGNAMDWVGLYPAGATSALANRLTFQFLNGLQTAPASGVSGATLTFALPGAGTYEDRIFLIISFTHIPLYQPVFCSAYRIT